LTKGTRGQVQGSDRQVAELELRDETASVAASRKLKRTAPRNFELSSGTFTTGTRREESISPSMVDTERVQKRDHTQGILRVCSRVDRLSPIHHDDNIQMYIYNVLRGALPTLVVITTGTCRAYPCDAVDLIVSLPPVVALANVLLDTRLFQGGQVVYLFAGSTSSCVLVSV
jgi:hypothetical protein